MFMNSFLKNHLDLILSWMDIFKTDFVSSMNVVPFSFCFLFHQILIVNFLLFISLKFSNLPT